MPFCSAGYPSELLEGMQCLRVHPCHCVLRKMGLCPTALGARSGPRRRQKEVQGAAPQGFGMRKGPGAGGGSLIFARKGVC